MGQKPSKPTYLKVLEGEKNKDRINPEEVEPTKKAPECPDYLDAETSATWKELSPILERLGLLTEVDGYAFENLCITRTRIKAVYDEIKKLDSLLEDGKAHPLTVMERQYSQQFRLQALDFGLTPRGRCGLIVGKQGKEEGGLGDILD